MLSGQLRLRLAPGHGSILTTRPPFCSAVAIAFPQPSRAWGFTELEPGASFDVQAQPMDDGGSPLQPARIGVGRGEDIGDDEGRQDG